MGGDSYTPGSTRGTARYGSDTYAPGRYDHSSRRDDSPPRRRRSRSRSIRRSRSPRFSPRRRSPSPMRRWSRSPRRSDTWAPGREGRDPHDRRRSRSRSREPRDDPRSRYKDVHWSPMRDRTRALSRDGSRESRDGNRHREFREGNRDRDTSRDRFRVRDRDRKRERSKEHSRDRKFGSERQRSRERSTDRNHKVPRSRSRSRSRSASRPRKRERRLSPVQALSPPRSPQRSPSPSRLQSLNRSTEPRDKSNCVSKTTSRQPTPPSRRRSRPPSSTIGHGTAVGPPSSRTHSPPTGSKEIFDVRQPASRSSPLPEFTAGQRRGSLNSNSPVQSPPFQRDLGGQRGRPGHLTNSNNMHLRNGYSNANNFMNGQSGRGGPHGPPAGPRNGSWHESAIHNSLDQLAFRDSRPRPSFGRRSSPSDMRSLDAGRPSVERDRNGVPTGPRATNTPRPYNGPTSLTLRINNPTPRAGPNSLAQVNQALPQIIPGGKLIPPHSVIQDNHDRLAKLNLESARLKQEIRIAQEKKRKALHQWDKFEREANSHEFKTSLNESQLEQIQSGLLWNDIQ